MEQTRSVGLTHDIGKIILLQFYPDRYQEIIDNQRKNPGISFYESELDLGLHENTHAEIGAYFLDWWNLPEIIVEVALFHHAPEKASEHYKEIVDISHFTDKLINYVWRMRKEQELDLSHFQNGNLSEFELNNISSEIKADMNKSQ